MTIGVASRPCARSRFRWILRGEHYGCRYLTGDFTGHADGLLENLGGNLGELLRARGKLAIDALLGERGSR
jgi:hypothetical protein